MKFFGRRDDERSPDDAAQTEILPGHDDLAAQPLKKGQKVLEVEGLCVDFGVNKEWVPAAIDMDYHVDAGEVLAIVGESGSGKSASSMALIGLLPSNARVRGSVKLLGRELVDMGSGRLRSIRGSDVAVIFQEPMTALNPVYTVGEQIVETLRLHKEISPSEAARQAMNMLELVELPDPDKAFQSFPHQLSGGQRQRAMIAQSLSCDPKLLIADEPTTALDVTVQAEILELLRNLKDKLDSAIILITHDMGVVADLSDRIAVMRRGRIVEQGDSREIFHRPHHPYTQELLAAVPHLGQRADGQVVVAEELLQMTDSTVAPEIFASSDRAAIAPVVHERRTIPDDAPVVLTMKDVCIDYPKQGRQPVFRAVSEATLDIRKGEIVGLVGESGSGKTTIGRAATGLLPVAAGSLRVGEIELMGAKRKVLNKVRHQVGMVFQDPASSLNPRLPIGESIGEPIFLAGQAKGAELQKRIESLLDRVELPRSYRNRYPHELSGGQKQRVGIARSLALKPTLLVADEPTSALDVSVQARVLELFDELQAEMGFACLFVTHDLAVIDQLADRIVVMKDGRIVEHGDRDAILRNPQDPYTKRLIAAVPVPDPDEQAARRELRNRIMAEGGSDSGPRTSTMLDER